MCMCRSRTLPLQTLPSLAFWGGYFGRDRATKGKLDCVSLDAIVSLVVWLDLRWPMPSIPQISHTVCNLTMRNIICCITASCSTVLSKH